jgi:pimeloyl-ACP methyl ester carboxylesterase
MIPWQNLPSETLKIVSEKIAVHRSGQGHFNIILLPGIGDTKESYHSLIKILSRDAVVHAVDLRGSGESSTDFSSFKIEDVADDISSLIKTHDLKDVIVVGNSGTAASAVCLAASHPERVRAMVVTGPFLRDQPSGSLSVLFYKFLFLKPWGPSIWKSYYQSLHKSVQPEDLAAHSDYLKNKLNEPGRLKALREMMFASKRTCEKKIPEVKSRAVVIMGTSDPDFENPVEEAKWVADQLHGTIFLMEGVGHYPHRERPEQMADVIRDLLK